jgi:hypothetical protein
MPDFADMTGAKSLQRQDPLGVDYLKSVAKNPLKESNSYSSRIKTSLPPDVMSALRNLSTKIDVQKNDKKVLSENEENLTQDDSIDSFRSLINNDEFER